MIGADEVSVAASANSSSSSSSPSSSELPLSPPTTSTMSISSIPGDFAHHSIKSARNSIFAKWLVETFSQSNLRFHGVVDIAGGQGALSFELAVRFGVPCTLIEPRENVKLNSIMHRRMQKICEQRSTGSVGHELLPDYLKANQEYIGDDGFVLEKVWEAVYKKSPLPFNHLQQEFRFPFSDQDSAILQAMREATVIVGVHPDQGFCAITYSFALSRHFTYRHILYHHTSPPPPVFILYSYRGHSRCIRCPE
jgi:16S rRNA G966 N2-methylase RsmD